MHTSKTKKSISKGPVRTGLSNLWEKLKLRSEMKRSALDLEMKAINRRSALKGMAALVGLGVVSACAPVTVHAEPTKPATAVDKEAGKGKTEKIMYETFNDPAELEPYFKNTEGKIFHVTKSYYHGFHTTNIEEYHIALEDEGSRADYTVWVGKDMWEDGYSYKGRIVFNVHPKEMNIFEIDMGDKHPYVKGKMVVFACYKGVQMLYYRKVGFTGLDGKWVPPGYEIAAIPFYNKDIRRGPVRTGFEIDEEGGIHVVVTPKKLGERDVFALGNLWSDGDSGAQFFVYRPDKPSGTMIASP